VLLRDPGTGAVGRAVVSSPQGQVNLQAMREATRVGAGAAPSQPIVLSEREVERVFGPALAALPAAARHFTLFFEFESEQLTDDGRRLVQEVLKEISSRPVPDVMAVGHTDTTGEARANVQLGLRRANAVRTIQVMAGLTSVAVQVASHGAAELAVPTTDNVFEPRNRRVEITVR
jgi:outer membrane protein OmpA-like peptidoglycan-associated protein